MGVFSKITGESGKGPIRTYIHKASNTGPDLNLTDTNYFFEKVYPWTEIQSAHREMAENKNRKVIHISTGSVIINTDLLFSKQW